MPLPWSDRDAADLSACRDLLRHGSRTFFAASMLLPSSVRAPASALYAFCRQADDAIDLAGGGGPTAVAALRERLDRVYDGRPMDFAADRALCEVVAHYAMPRALPEALVEGFEWDSAGRRYGTLDELHDYAARVAGSVGAMMSVLMGARSPDALARACDLGVAMQLSNIARDVGEDARNGRVYLPLQWLAEAGIDVETWLRQPAFDSRLAGVVQRLLDAADSLYRRVPDGVARLPLGCRPAIHAARLLYAEIGHEVARSGHDSVSRRAVVGRARKARVIAGALAACARPVEPVTLPPLEQTRFLVDAVIATPLRRERRAVQPGVVEQRVGWMVDLFHRLEQQEHNAIRARGMRAGGMAPAAGNGSGAG